MFRSTQMAMSERVRAQGAEEENQTDDEEVSMGSEALSPLS